MTDRAVYVSLEGLRRRGWSDRMVRELLGGPDVRGWGVRQVSRAPVLLYQLTRVEAVERARTSVAPRLMARRRRQAVLAALRVEPIRVPMLPRAELERRAVLYRRQVAAGAEQDAGGLVRWQVGYLRQALRSYDALLDGLGTATGRADAERLLRHRVYRAIAQAYPWLAEECARRLRDPGGRR
ncbi:hypothetical protein [Streptomyces sp. CC210A]|uniref:hypothetical protein n=1 Tax=Streptomyces sp. CC210A TaxID=2898184 RepID=UPI001F20737F|nr:hypothetical protein [Streptomyces sp. CC210A]